MAGHQVIDCIDRAGGAVLNGKDAVLAHPALHRSEHMVEGIEVKDGGGFENTIAGDLGVRPLDALTGHGGPLGKELRRGPQSGPDALIDRRAGATTLLLVGAAGRHDGAEHRLCIVGQVLPRQTAHLGQQGPFPAYVQRGEAVLLLIGGHLTGDRHPLLEQLHQLLVDAVDLIPQLR